MERADSSPLTMVSLQALAAAGREVTLPARLASDVGELELLDVLRLLPGRRLTARARFQGRMVIAKLFFSHSKSVHDAAHEVQRLQRIADLDVAVPSLLADSGPGERGRVLILEMLPGESALAVYRRARVDGQGHGVALRLLPFLAALHDCGCVQNDAHLGNFLLDRDRIFLVDAGSIEIHNPLPPARRCRNLADLLAQFYPLDVVDMAALRAAYGPRAPSTPALMRALERARRRRYRHALGKIERDCTDFAPVHSGDLRGMASRDLSTDFQNLLAADPDRVMASSETLKDGNSSTVSRIQWGEHDWVIKRYNVKSVWHRVKKQFKPSRARRSWRNARWLDLIGLPTPDAVGYAERRVAGLLDAAYFVCRYTAGTPVNELREPALSPARRCMENVFSLMAALRFSHGDMKASNFLWRDGRLWILDLDAMQINLSKRQARKKVARDRVRWSRNWSSAGDDESEEMLSR